MDILIFVEVVGVVEVADVGPELQGEEGKRGPVDLGQNILIGDCTRQKRGSITSIFQSKCFKLDNTIKIFSDAQKFFACSKVLNKQCKSILQIEHCL